LSRHLPRGQRQLFNNLVHAGLTEFNRRGEENGFLISVFSFEFVATSSLRFDTLF